MLGFKTTLVLIAVLIAIICSMLPMGTEPEITTGHILPHMVTDTYFTSSPVYGTVMKGKYYGGLVDVESYQMPPYEDYLAAWLDLYPDYCSIDGKSAAERWYWIGMPDCWFGYYTTPYRWYDEGLAKHYYKIHPDRMEIEGYGV